MFDSPATVAALISIGSILLISGIGVSFLLGRRTARKVPLTVDEDEFRLPDRVAKELIRCLELGDYVSRDADSLTAAVASQPSGTPRPVNSALQQFVKTTKSLLGRLNRVGTAARIARPDASEHAISLPPATADPCHVSSATNSRPDQSDSELAATIRSLPSGHECGNSSCEARHFPRSAFRGVAWATIYPAHPSARREPLRCEVLTRDLSCGGIGIAHTEPFFPKQIIVLDTLGKLLVSEVRWCRRVDENIYVAGCRLVKTTT